MSKSMKLPSEVNIFPSQVNVGKQWDTSSAPWEFYTENTETGDRTSKDIRAQEFEIKIYFNDCIVYELDQTEIINGVNTIDSNKLYVVTTGFDFKRRGKYNFIVFFKDGVSVIKGVLNVI